MNQQYRIINQCLQLLKQCEIPPILKLQAEVQLICMKRLLIDADGPTAKDRAIHEALALIGRIHNGGECNAVDDLMEHLLCLVGEGSSVGVASAQQQKLHRPAVEGKSM